VTPDRFTRMVEPHLDVVHRLARRLCRTRSDAEDLAQEALVRAFEKRASLRDPARVRPWILALLRNLHLNRVRDEKPHLMVLSGSHPTLGTNAEPRGNLAVEIEAKFLGLAEPVLGRRAARQVRDAVLALADDGPVAAVTAPVREQPDRRSA